MDADEVVEVDIDQVTDADRRALVAFERIMWSEYAPEEVSMAEQPAFWFATRRRPNATKVTWVVRAEPRHDLAGVAALRLPFVDNRHLGHVNLNPVGAAYYGFSTQLCTPNSLSQEVGAALGAQPAKRGSPRC